jgi:acyl carrier protein
MIYEKLVSIMTDRLSVSPQEITPDTIFKDDLAVDSLDLYELVMALEEEFNVEIPAERLNDVEVVSDVIRVLKELGVED